MKCTACEDYAIYLRLADPAVSAPYYSPFEHLEISCPACEDRLKALDLKRKQLEDALPTVPFDEPTIWEIKTLPMSTSEKEAFKKEWNAVQAPPAQEMVDGLLVSTDTLAYHLIPVVAIQRLCERIMLGEKTKGKDAWNALSDNQQVLDSKKALARRLGHTINHAYRLLNKIQQEEHWVEEDEREASAVMWGGMYAICAINAQRKVDQ